MNITNEDLMEELKRLGRAVHDNSALLIAVIPSHKLPAKLAKLRMAAVTPSNHLEPRMGEMLRVFNSTAQMTQTAKIAQNFPARIVQGLAKTPWEIVPKSILLNRSAQRRIFAPVLEHHEASSMENAKNTLEALVNDGKLFVAMLSDTTMKEDKHTKRHSKAMCVFSPIEAGKHGLTEVEEANANVDVVEEKPKIAKIEKTYFEIKAAENIAKKILDRLCEDCSKVLEDHEVTICDPCRRAFKESRKGVDVEILRWTPLKEEKSEEQKECSACAEILLEHEVDVCDECRKKEKKISL